VTTEQPSQAATSQNVLEFCVTADEDWLDIETDAILMGYVKHPLRRILEWLDRFIAWIEKRLAAIWMNTRSFVAGFLGLPDRP
jgi:hypothetical protein